MKISTKKILAIILSAVCLLTMSGCVSVAGFSLLLCTVACNGPEPYPFIHETDALADAKIELVTVTWVESDSGEAGNYGLETIKVIDDADSEEFLAEFAAIGFTYPYEPRYGLGIGPGVCFTYPDGQVEVVTPYGCGLFADRSLEESIRFNGRFGEEELLAFCEKWAEE